VVGVGMDIFEVLGRKDEKIFRGGLGGWGTIYLDIRETISIDSNISFRLL
jgi:hypothetical protein